MPKKSLSEYDAKRTFSATPEPPPETASGRKGPLMFCIQQHNATRLHYDLRLELEGVLISWAVPKGPSYEPGTKHIAVHVEDHPFDYASFEGSIPKGNYGAGEVIVWDTGTYWCDEHDAYTCTDREDMEKMIRQELDKGKVSIFFRGHKMKGSWALVKLKDKDDWLFFKHNDHLANRVKDLTELGESVISGLTIEDLKRGTKPARKYRAEELAPGAKIEKFPRNLEPMKATLADAPFDRQGWIFEPKLDGIRALVYIENNEVKMFSRRGLEMTQSFPEVAEHLKKQQVNKMILDGEIIAFGPDGKASFHNMQQRMNLKDKAAIARADKEWPTVFYAFDILHFEGADTRSAPLHDRKRWLEQAVIPSAKVQITTFVEEDGIDFYNTVVAAGFEGVMAKKYDSKYEQGKRSHIWLKVKSTDSAEYVVTGYSKGEGSRSDAFGSLVLGYYKDGDLIFGGQVGSGFNDQSIKDFTGRLKKIERKTMPFKEKPAVIGKITWTEPEIVIEVKFNEVTPLGLLRAPVFLGVREDVDPKKVTGPVKPVHVDSEEPEEKPKAKTSTAKEKPDSEPQKPAKGVSKEIEQVLAQLDEGHKNMILEIGEHKVNLTNLDKHLWPENKEMELEPFTKRDLLRYYAQVSPYMLPHLKDRPLTMIRFPEGIHGEKFFQKHYEHKNPPFIDSVKIYSGSREDDKPYLLIDNLASLIWLGQMGTLECHVTAARIVGGADAKGLGTTFTGSIENVEASLFNHPDYIEFDLDPYIYSGKEAKGDEPELHPVGFERAKTVAFWLKDLLDSLKLHAYVKTTGKTGLHIFVPIVRNLNYEEVRSICEMLCKTILADHPKDVTMEWSVPKRTGKVFLDFNMNVRFKTLGAAYTPRALPNQSLGMPVTWEELPKIYPTDFTMRNVIPRLQKHGDVWHDILAHKVDLRKILQMP